MLRILSLLLAATTATAFAQSTTVTASNLRMGGSPITSGTVTIVPQDPYGHPIAFTGGDGSFNGPQPFSAIITNGAIAAGFTVPDQSLSVATTPNTPLWYAVTVTNSITKTSFSYTLPPSTVVGQTFALDLYKTTQFAGALTGTTNATSLPSSLWCSTGARIVLGNGSAITGLYECYFGQMRQVPMGGGSGSGPAPTFQVGTVSTGAAAVQLVAGANNVYTLNFTVPQGTQGQTGTPGTTPSFTVNSVTTGAAGSQAAVTVDPSSTPSNIKLNFTIPQGVAGQTGQAGQNGTSGSGTSIALKVNGTANVSQSVLNLKAGSNITLADDGSGGVTVSVPNLATVATSGNYNDLSNRPTIPSASSGSTLLYKNYQYTSSSFAQDFTTVGTAPAITSAGMIQFNSTAGSVTGQQVILNKASTVTNSENWTMRVSFILGAVGGANGYGFVPARYSINPYNGAQQGMLLNFSTNSNTLSFNTFNGSAQGNANTASVPFTVNPAAGDSITLLLVQRQNCLFGAAYDETNNSQTLLKSCDNLTSSHSTIVPNTAKFAMLDFGGTYTITSIRITEDSAPSPNLCVIGDSKTEGYGGGAADSRWAAMLDAYGPVAVFSGGGDGTAQVLAALPVILQKNCKNVLLAAFYYNDVGFGTLSASQIQSTYSSIASQFKAAGVHVIHMKSIPTSGGANTASMDTWLTNTYGPSGANDTIIDPTVNFSTSSMLYTDGIHENPAGDLNTATNINAQIGLTAPATATFYRAPYPYPLY